MSHALAVGGGAGGPTIKQGSRRSPAQRKLMRALRQRAAVSASPAGIADTDAVVAVALAVAVGRAGELGTSGARASARTARPAMSHESLDEPRIVAEERPPREFAPKKGGSAGGG